MERREVVPRLAIVLPAYNEEAVLEKTIEALDPILTDLMLQNKITSNSYMMFVDDGSVDQTWAIISSFHAANKERYKGLKLAKNSGHQNALLSGLLHAKDQADCVISLDVDLQDDINLIYQFIDSYHEGYDVVYGIRDSRETDTFFKRNTALLYYKMLRKFGVQIKHNHADYRLMSKAVLDQLAHFTETNIFLRGIVPLLGFPSKEIYYDRQERAAGETKYPLKKMLQFAVEGITSFSNFPLRLISFLGFFIFVISVGLSVYALLQSLIFHNVIRGWTSIVLSLYALSGAQLLCLGVIGEYIGKIYSETKKRPKFIIERSLM